MNIWVTLEVICQWFSLVTSSLGKIIGKSPHSWPKNRHWQKLMHYSLYATLCNRNVHTHTHFCHKVVHCEIWNCCIVGFVILIYYHIREALLVTNIFNWITAFEVTYHGFSIRGDLKGHCHLYILFEVNLRLQMLAKDSCHESLANICNPQITSKYIKMRIK